MTPTLLHVAPCPACLFQSLARSRDAVEAGLVGHVVAMHDGRANERQ